MPVGGVVYILEQTAGSQERHIWSFHTSTTILSSIPTSTKRPFYAIFTHFNIVKNHKKYLQNTPQPLKNKASIELDQNLQKIHTNYSKQNTPSNLISPTKIKHFLQSDHLKITLSPNSSKFTSPIQSSNRNTTLITNPKFLTPISHHIPHK